MGGSEGGMKSFEGGVALEGEAVRLVEERLGFRVTANFDGLSWTRTEMCGFICLLLAACQEEAEEAAF